MMHKNIRKNKGYWESLDDVDDLVHGCRCLLEDREGNIWIGSRRRGLSRYDGRRFVNFTDEDGLTDNGVQCIHQDKEGIIWIGTRGGGISCYNGGEFVNFTESDGLVNNNVRCILQDGEENIWIGTRRGLSRYDGNGFVSFTREDGLVYDNTRCILQDREGNIWIGTTRGLSRYDGREFVNFTDKDGLIHNTVQCIYQDKEGNIWIGNPLYYIMFYDGEEFTNINDKDGLAHNNVVCIRQDREGNIWIGTDGGGVSYYDGHDFVNFTTEDGLAGNSVFDIIQDREGSIWFACHHGGISRFNPYQFSLISNESVGETIIQDSSGALWWGSRNILSQYHGKSVKHHYSFGGTIYNLFEDSKGQLWISTEGGVVAKYSDVENVKGQEPWILTMNDELLKSLINNTMTRVYEDRQGNIWIGTYVGIYRYDGVEVTNFSADNGLDIHLVSAIFQDSSGTLWFGGWGGGGITTYDGESFHRYTTDDGLASNEIICITEDGKGNIWIGTRISISLYDGESFRNYTAADGLVGSSARRMLQNREGQIWAAMLAGGISRFDGRNFQVLTTADGLPSNNVTGIIEDSDGSMIISTYKGVCRYLPDYETPPLIRIDEIDAGKIYTEPEEIQISESVSSLRIRYHGLSFKTKRMKYNYIMEGYDKDWKATWNREARYESLPIGEYTFKVIAVNRDLVYSEKPAQLRLKVLADPRDQVITELEEEVKERTAELWESEMQYRTTIDSISDAIHVVDTNLKIVLFNTAFGKWCEEVGLETDSIGRDLLSAFPFLTERIREEYNHVFDTGDPLITEETTRIGNERFITETRKIPIFESGKVIRIVTIVRNITEKRSMEAELLRAQKLESVGILAGGIAHDFNNILAAILGNISLAKLCVKPADKAFEKLTEAERASLRARDLTQQLLTFSRGGEPIKKTISIVALMEEAAGFALRGSNVGCDFSMADDLWSLEADEGQISQVINNLVINANQAMPEGGVIKIQAENIVVDARDSLPLKGGRYVKITVQDQGIGISEEHLQKIFDPYFTTKQRGSGLGLAISHSVIKNHNGYIAVESQVGVGTKFGIYLPASSEKVLTKAEKGEEAPLKGIGKILVMDDEEMVRYMVREMLYHMGYEAITAKDGAEAIQLYKDAAGSGHPFDIVIMDLTVPGGMGGKEAVQGLLQIDPNAKAIVSSGYSNDPIMSDFRRYGFSGVIAKPYGIKKLSEILYGAK